VLLIVAMHAKLISQGFEIHGFIDNPPVVVDVIATVVVTDTGIIVVVTDTGIIVVVTDTGIVAIVVDAVKHDIVAHTQKCPFEVGTHK